MAINTKLVVISALGMLGAAAVVVSALLIYRPRVYEGHLSVGFETSAFLPCDPDYKDERWWASGLPPEGHARYRELTTKMYEPVYLKVRAVRSRKGSYGHLGSYQRELTILELLELRPAQPGDCGGRGAPGAAP